MAAETEKRGQGLEPLHTRSHLRKWVRLSARPVPATLSPAAAPAAPGSAMKVLLFTGLGALFFSYYWDDNFDPGECLVGEGGIWPAVRCTPRVDHSPTLPASLQGARVLLTGASAGVGEELAYHYARLGSHLVLTAHTEALLQKVRHPISRLMAGCAWVESGARAC